MAIDTGRRRQEQFAFQAIGCPLCSTATFDVLGRKSGGYYSGAADSMAQVVRCTVCRLIYANPMPAPAKPDLTELYNEDYTKLLSEFVAYGDRAPDFVDIREGHRRLARLERLLGRRGALLDIGCGPGNLLCVARARGWAVTGLEVNEESARFAREVNHVDVVAGRIEDLADGWTARFDVVHFNQVLEHLYEPRAFLDAVRRVVRDDGVVFCGVPHEDSVINRLAQLYFKLRGSEFTPMLAPTFPPYHVLGFSPRTVRRMLEGAGFQVVDIEQVNESRLDVGALRRGEILRAVKSVVGLAARLVGVGHGLDVYGRAA